VQPARAISVSRTLTMASAGREGVDRRSDSMHAGMDFLRGPATGDSSVWQRRKAQDRRGHAPATAAAPQFRQGLNALRSQLSV
jgi:hypothetical protein